MLVATATVEIKAAASLVETQDHASAVASDTSRNLAIDCPLISSDNSTTIKSDPATRLSSVEFPLHYSSSINNSYTVSNSSL